MKLTAVFLFFACLQVSARVNGQRISLNVNTVPLSKVFKSMQQQTGYDFLYSSETLQQAGNVSLNLKNASLKEALQACLKGKDLSYKIQGNTVIIVKKKTRQPIATVAQATRYTLDETVEKPVVSVTGTVVDSTGAPLASVFVKMKGTQKSTITKDDGTFEFKDIDPAKATLIFSYVGFQTQEIALAGRTQLHVTLHMKTEVLDEMVINTGYQQINKESFTGTALTVSGADLKTVNPQNLLKSLSTFDPSFRLMDNTLQGSNPNAMPNITVRGATALPANTTDAISRNTLTGTSNMPTFILDGYEVDVQKVYDLDINNIKSVTLLKDAAATAVYGSRAANGVVVIVTNPPKEGKLQASYNFENYLTTPDLSVYHVLNASQKLDYEKTAGLYDAAINKGYTQDQLNELYYHKYNLILSGVNTDWISQPVRNSYGQKHSIYLEGGSTAFRYGLAMRYQTQPGVMKGSGRDRLSTDLNLSYNLNNAFLFKNTLSVTRMNSKESPYGNFEDYVNMNPYYPKTDADGNIIQVIDTWVSHASNGTNTVNPVLNPLYNSTLASFNKSNYTQIVDMLAADWHIINSLRLRGTMSISQTTTDNNAFTSPFANAYYYYTSSQANQRGQYNYNNQNETVLDGNLTLNYNKRIGKHFLNAILGSNIRSEKSDYKGFVATGFTNDKFSNIGFANSYASGSTPDGDRTETRLVGAFTSVNYSYDDRYLLDFTYRQDGSSNFGSNNRIAPFNALGIGWNMHKEAFMQHSPFSRLKIRASTGLTGSVSFSPYMSQTMYNYYMSNWYATGAGAIVTNFGNNNLEWQKTRNYDLGMEIGFMGDRLLIMPRYYQKLTKGLITDVTLPPSTGFDSYKANIGDMRNTGWELNIQYAVIRNKDFNLNLTANMVHNTNTIVKISDALKAYNTKVDDAQSDPSNLGAPLLHYKEGQSLNTIYGVRSLGIDPENGKEIFVKQNGNLTYDWSASDIVPIGNSTPKVEGYFGSNIRYKQFNVSFTFYTKFGGQSYNQTVVDRIENADPRYNVDSRALSQRWQKPGDHALYKNIADLSTTQVSSRFIEKDNVLELSSFYLSYDAKKSLTTKLGMSNLRFALTANDLFRVSSIRTERGINYPYAHSFTLAMTANF